LDVKLKSAEADAERGQQEVSRMTISVSSATQVQTPVEVQPASARQPVSAPKPPAATVPQAAATVNISAAAQSLQEVTETPAQTTREAGAGDLQARRLLAREAAAQALK
jgi:hypothetical protein